MTPRPLLRSLDLFSGIGGITRALHGLAEPLAYCDWAIESRRALQANMQAGRLPKAPISADVRELGADWLTKHAKAMPDIIVGGFPCVGFSTAGHRKGFGEHQSGLFSEILRLADETRCPLLFLENVTNVINIGMHDVAHELATKRGYELRWCVVAAEDMGAPHRRARWFCLACRPGYRIRWPKATRYSPHPWTAATMPPRAINVATNGTRASMRLLGNSVVPDAVRYAFLYLVGGCETVPKTLSTPAGYSLAPAKKKTGIPPGRRVFSPGRIEWPKCGIVSQTDRTPISCTQLPPFRASMRLKLVFDPTLFRTSKPPSDTIRQPRLTEPMQANKWATPRHGCITGVNYITERTTHDLPTQVRFEASTRDRDRAGGVNPDFVEWLMGYPRGWTSAGGDLRTQTGSVS
jgi:hypothetical protein